MRQINKRWTQKGLALGLALTLSVSLAACGKKDNKEAADTSKALATYKGGEITQAEFDKFMGVNKVLDPQMASALDSPEYKGFIEKQMLTQEAVLEILSKEATDTAKTEGEKKATEYLEPIKSWDKTQKDSFDQKLKEANITQKDVEDYFKQTFVVMADMDAKVTDQQVKDDYDKRLKEDPHFYDIVTVRHILVSTKDPADPEGKKVLRTDEDALKRAKEVQDKLNKGGDFDALAKEYSDDPGSKENGGKYENQSVGNSSFVPEFTKAMAELPVNKVSDPVKSDYGYHVMRVDTRKTETLDEKKDEIRSTLGQSLINDFMEKKLPDYEFKSNLPEPSMPAAPETSAAPGAGASPGASAAPSASPSAEPSKK
ncbi:peptidylprolyl isomerase [Paenibacillus sp. CC-CFT747]|nr:peptidylprolyl isomerase [Paenibacillus sp. CC-CFT747]